MTEGPEVVVLGANGMLGSMLCRYLATRDMKVTAVTRATFDAGSADAFQFHTLFGKGARFVINCIVHDVRSSDCEESLKVNALFPCKLGYACAAMDVKLIHISTNAVFSGRRGGRLETDVPDPIDLYGTTKLLGECSRAMVLRTSIIGPERRSRGYLLQWAIEQAGKTVQGYTNHYWNGVTTDTMANVIFDIISEERFEEGVFHIHSREAMSKCGLISLISDTYGLRLKVTGTEAETPSDRTLSSTYRLSDELVRTTIKAQLEALKGMSPASRH